MKSLLSILGALGLVSTASTSVISCDLGGGAYAPDDGGKVDPDNGGGGNDPDNGGGGKVDPDDEFPSDITLDAKLKEILLVDPVKQGTENIYKVTFDYDSTNGSNNHAKDGFAYYWEALFGYIREKHTETKSQEFDKIVQGKANDDKLFIDHDKIKNDDGSKAKKLHVKYKDNTEEYAQIDVSYHFVK